MRHILSLNTCIIRFDKIWIFHNRPFFHRIFLYVISKFEMGKITGRWGEVISQVNKVTDIGIDPLLRIIIEYVRPLYPLKLEPIDFLNASTAEVCCLDDEESFSINFSTTSNDQELYHCPPVLSTNTVTELAKESRDGRSVRWTISYPEKNWKEYSSTRDYPILCCGIAKWNAETDLLLSVFNIVRFDFDVSQNVARLGVGFKTLRRSERCKRLPDVTVGQKLGDQRSFILNFNIKTRILHVENFPALRGHIEDKFLLTEMTIYIASPNCSDIVVTRLHD